MSHFNFTGCRIIVVGDLLLDKYLSGSVQRLSPEAPVPVLLREAERAVLGGAANVCANLAALGAEVIVVGVIGRDEPGSVLVNLLRAYPKVRTDHLVTDVNRPTTCKIRVTSGIHQMVRIDSESREDITGEIEEAVASAILHGLPWADVVVLSDYAKGLCNDRIIRTFIDKAAEAGKASIIDSQAPRFLDLSRRNADQAKPVRIDRCDRYALRNGRAGRNGRARCDRPDKLGHSPNPFGTRDVLFRTQQEAAAFENSGPGRVRPLGCR
jgi:rfaE bifunctional protein kinase chain/domain